MKKIKIKKALDVKKLMMAVALTACIVNHAFAASPREESVIMHDRIVLGDVFDGVEKNADHYLAPAPAVGRSVTLNANDLTRISEAFNLGWAANGAPEQVVIRRVSSEVPRSAVEKAVERELSEKTKGMKFEMKMDNAAAPLSFPEGAADKNVDVDSLSYDAANGTFRALVSASAAPDVKKEITGRIFQIRQVPVLKEPLRSGDVISSSDIDYIEMRANDITSNMVVDAQKLVGLTPRRGIPAMKPLTSSDVQMPVLVKKGDIVTIALKNGSISLTAQGRALDDGAEGAAIRVMNTSSKQTISAAVTGTGTVAVAAPSGALALNTL